MVAASGQAREADGFQGVRGAINQIGLSAYWLPADPKNPCADWLSVECQPLGTEEVDGRRASKWAVTRYFDDQSALSYIWVDTRLHIVSRIRVAGRTTELRNVIEIFQPSALFEAPE